MATPVTALLDSWRAADTNSCSDPLTVVVRAGERDPDVLLHLTRAVLSATNTQSFLDTNPADLDAASHDLDFPFFGRCDRVKGGAGGGMGGGDALSGDLANAANARGVSATVSASTDHQSRSMSNAPDPLLAAAAIDGGGSGSPSWIGATGRAAGAERASASAHPAVASPYEAAAKTARPETASLAVEEGPLSTTGLSRTRERRDSVSSSKSALVPPPEISVEPPNDAIIVAPSGGLAFESALPAARKVLHPSPVPAETSTSPAGTIPRTGGATVGSALSRCPYCNEPSSRFCKETGRRHETRDEAAERRWRHLYRQMVVASSFISMARLSKKNTCEVDDTVELVF
jgi:hypothetical protein